MQMYGIMKPEIEKEVRGTNQMDYCTDRKESVEVKNGKLVITSEGLAPAIK